MFDFDAFNEPDWFIQALPFTAALRCWRPAWPSAPSLISRRAEEKRRPGTQAAQGRRQALLLGMLI